MSNDQKSAKFLAQIGLACLQFGNKSPCLFAYHPQISLPICVSSQISLPICVSSTNLPAYLRIFLPICAKNFACFYSFDQWMLFLLLPLMMMIMMLLLLSSLIL